MISFVATHLLTNNSIGPDVPVEIINRQAFHATVQDIDGNRAKVTWNLLRELDQ